MSVRTRMKAVVTSRAFLLAGGFAVGASAAGGIAHASIPGPPG